MHRIDGYGATEDNEFTEGDPGNEIPATDVTDDWLNDMQEELANVVEAAGIELVKGNQTQLLEAIKTLAWGGGGGVKTITNAESPYTVLAADSILLVDCTDGVVVVDFLSAAVPAAKKLTIKKIDGTENAVENTPFAAQTVEGEAGSYDSIIEGEFMSFIPDGVDAWHRTG